MKSTGDHYKVLINKLTVVVTMDTKHNTLLLSSVATNQMTTSIR